MFFKPRRAFLAERNFSLRKWHSNFTNLMGCIRDTESTEHATLGLEDQVKCKSIVEEDQMYTKRLLASTVTRRVCGGDCAQRRRRLHNHVRWPRVTYKNSHQIKKI